MNNSSVDEIKSKLDIIDVINGYIRLQKAGRNYRANCPFHSEKTPSFMVSPEKQMWHCFGCGKGGSIFDFVMEMEGMEFGDALKVLAQRAGVELKKIDPKLSARLKTERTRLYEICDWASRFFVKQLESAAGKKMRDYLVGRGLKSETIAGWRIGYAPNEWQALTDFLNSRGYPTAEILKAGLAVKNDRGKYYDRFRDRIIFPINDINDMVIGFTGRENPNNPDKRMGKYINIPNTPIYDKSRVLYGLNKAKLDIKKENLCVLVEGQMDVIMAHQSGFGNVVASSGTALTEYQLKTIKRYTENLATSFDMDAAGKEATKRGINLAVELGFSAKVISLPAAKDPADYLKENAETWPKMLKQAQNLIEFCLNNALKSNDAETAEGKKEISKSVLPIIKRIPNKIEQAYWIQETAKKLGVGETVLMQELDKINFSPLLVNSDPVFPVKNSGGHKMDLEEYAIGLALSCSEGQNQYRIEPKCLFTNSQLGEIFEAIKNTKKKKIVLADLKKKLPPHLAEQIDSLAFKAEVQKCLADEFEPEKEIKFCFRQLKKKFLKDKLSKLSLAIKQAESKKDKTLLKNLMEEFAQLSKEIS